MVKNHFFGLSSKNNPVSGRAMIKGKMLHFVAFFVHFDKLIRPHPGPLWGGVSGKKDTNVSSKSVSSSSNTI